MNRKIIGIFILTLLIFAFTVQVSSHYEDQSKSMKNIQTDLTYKLDTLDQYSTQAKEYFKISSDYAQEFSPTLHTLTRVQCYLRRDGSIPYKNYRLEIRSGSSVWGPIGSDIVDKRISGNKILSGSNWIEFDVDDTAVFPGEEYFIRIWAEGSEIGSGSVYWWYGYDFPSPYPNGDLWYRNLVWNWFLHDNMYQSDACFKTFGLANQAPNKPTITGNNNGRTGDTLFFEVVSIDPEDDDVSYQIDWDEGISKLPWSYYKDSGNPYIDSHVWDEKGTYTIKARAKDNFGGISDWASFQVSMSKNKTYLNTPFLNFFENHPNLFPILRQLLKL